VFEQAGCDACHSGELLTDAQQYALDTSLRSVDTPSLIGLAHSRPYFHDGSAPDLWTLLTDRGTVHDMADTSELSDAQLHDLVAYLESL
jgi:cytochrome c peroxidase